MRDTESASRLTCLWEPDAYHQTASHSEVGPQKVKVEADHVSLRSEKAMPELDTNNMSLCNEVNHMPWRTRMEAAFLLAVG
jgi:hypothetical protein